MTAPAPFGGVAPYPNRRTIWLTMSDGETYRPPERFPCLRWASVEEWASEHVHPRHLREFY